MYGLLQVFCRGCPDEAGSPVQILFFAIFATMEDIVYYPAPDPYLVPTDEAKELRHATFQQQITEFAWNEIVRQNKQYCLIKIGHFNKHRDASLFFVDRTEIKKTMQALANLALTAEVVRDIHQTDAFGDGVVYLLVARPKTDASNLEMEL